MKIKVLIFLMALGIHNISWASCVEDMLSAIRNAQIACPPGPNCDGNTPPNQTCTTCHVDVERVAAAGASIFQVYRVTDITGPYPSTARDPYGNFADCGTGTPVARQPTANKISASCPVKGSIVQTQEQILSEKVPVVGANFNMFYNSRYVFGRSGDYKALVTFTTATPDPNIVSFDFEVKREGTTIYTNSYSNSVTNQQYTYTWDGLDASGNEILGTLPVSFKVVEHYTAGDSFAFNSVANLGHFNVKLLGLGGWIPDIYNFYDLPSATLFRGDGTLRQVTAKVWNTTGYMIPSEDGKQVYYFDSTGRQVYTKTGLTGTTIFTFNYDSNGYLASITEPFSRTTTFDRNSSDEFVSITSPKGQVTTVTLDTNGYVSTFTNPNSEAYLMTYSSTQLGLLHTFQKPHGEVSTFTFDSDGNLTRDSHSGGYFFDLVRNLASSYDVSVNMTTNMGRVTTYNSGESAKSITRNVLMPSGLADSFSYISSDTVANSSWTSDGNSVTKRYAPDKRFGMLAPFMDYSTVGMSGVSYDISNSQSITLSDVNDPFSILTYSTTSHKGSASVTTTYDPSTKIFSSVTGLGRSSQVGIDSYERVVSAQKGTLYPVEITYTNENVTKVKQNTRETNLSYNASGLLSNVTNPLSQTTGYVYDSAGRVTSTILPDLRVVGFSYDANGNLSGVTPPGRGLHGFTIDANEMPSAYQPPALTGVTNVNTTYTYNDDKQLLSINKPNGDTISYVYGSTSGQNTRITTPSGSYYINMQTARGLPLNILTPAGWYTTLAYSGDNLTQFNIYDGSYSFYYTYAKSLNSNGTIDSDYVSTNSGMKRIYYTYDNDEVLTGAGDLTLTKNTPNGMLTATSIGTGSNIVTDSYTYNSFGEITGYQAKYGTTVIYDLTLGRDSMGRINSKTQTMNSTTDAYSYTFDTTGRLTQTDKNSTTVATYGYDDNSNRNSGTIGSQPTTATYDAQDRMTAYNLLSFTYNANGDLTSKTNTLTSTTTSYTYDAFGNLTSVTLPSSDVITYEFDGLNRRMGKKLNGTLQKRWIYIDQTRIAAELDSSGNIVKRFIYASKSNIPDYMVMGGDNYRIISDQLGSPRLVVKVSDGSIAERMDHDEFGRVIADTNPGLLPFGFAGGLYDTDTQLVRFGARDYDAETGRWTAKDPMLFGAGDTNLFGYTFQDPVNFIDPRGLWSISLTGGAAAGASSKPGSCGDGGQVEASSGIIIGTENGSFVAGGVTSTGTGHDVTGINAGVGLNLTISSGNTSSVGGSGTSSTTVLGGASISISRDGNGSVNGVTISLGGHGWGVGNYNTNTNTTVATVPIY